MLDFSTEEGRDSYRGVLRAQKKPGHNPLSRFNVIVQKYKRAYPWLTEQETWTLAFEEQRGDPARKKIRTELEPPDTSPVKPAFKVIEEAKEAAIRKEIASANGKPDKGGKKSQRFEPEPEDFDIPLVPQRIFEGKSCTEPEALQWVAANLAVTVDDALALARSAPSATAYAILRFARTNPAQQRGFWETMYLKLMPTAKEIERQKRASSDGSILIKMINEIRYLENGRIKREKRKAEKKAIEEAAKAGVELAPAPEETDEPEIEDDE
jgi:hypothetical protein